MPDIQQKIQQLGSAAPQDVPVLCHHAVDLVEAHSLAVSDLQQHGALQPALALLQHKSPSVVGAALAILACSATQGVGQATCLAADPHAATLLASILSKHAQEVNAADAVGRTSVMQPGSLAAASGQQPSIHTAASRLHSVLQLLWSVTSAPEAPGLLVQFAPGVVPSLLGLMSQPSTRLMACTLGCLLNLSAGVPSVAAQLSRNTDLLYLLATMAGRTDQAAAAMAGVVASAPPSSAAPNGGGGGGGVGAGGVDVEQEVEVELLAIANATGLLGSLLVGRAQVKQLLSKEHAVTRIIQGLLLTPTTPRLHAACVQLRESAGLVLCRLMEQGGSVNQLQALLHQLMTRVTNITDEAAQQLLATSAVRRCLMVPMRIVTANQLDLGQQQQQQTFDRDSQGRDRDSVRPSPAMSVTNMGAATPIAPMSHYGSSSYGTMTMTQSFVAVPAGAEKSAARLSGAAVAGLVLAVPPPPALRDMYKHRDLLLQVCQNALHTLKSLVSTDECALALASDEHGLVQVLSQLVYGPMTAPSTSEGGDQEPGMTADAVGQGPLLQVQMVAASTLAALAQYACMRHVPSMQTALRPSSALLAQLSGLLAWQPDEPQRPDSGVLPSLDPEIYVHSCVTCLLAAIATNATADEGHFTQALVQVRGALGAVISLIPEHCVALSSAGGPGVLRPTSQMALPGAHLSLTGGPTAAAGASPLDPSPLQVSVPDSWILEYHHALAQIAIPRLDLAEPRMKVLPDGVMAALALLRVVCGKRQLAKVLATKTSLVATCVNLMSGNSTAVSMWHHSGYTEARWRSLLVQQGVTTLSSLVKGLDDTTITQEVSCDPDLLTALMFTLQVPSAATRAAAFELANNLMDNNSFVQALGQRSQAVDLMHLAMAELGMLPNSHAIAASPMVKNGIWTPLRGPATAGAAAALLSPLSMMSGLSGGAAPSLCTPEHTAAAATLLRLVQLQPVPLSHCLLVPGALDKMVQRLAYLVDELPDRGAAALASSGPLMQSLVGLIAHCVAWGVLPSLLPPPAGEGRTQGLATLIIPGTMGDIVFALSEVPELLSVLCDLVEWTWVLAQAEDPEKRAHLQSSAPGLSPSLSRMRSPTRGTISRLAPQQAKSVQIAGTVVVLGGDHSSRSGPLAPGADPQAAALTSQDVAPSSTDWGRSPGVVVGAGVWWGVIATQHRIGCPSGAGLVVLAAWRVLVRGWVRP